MTAENTDALTRMVADLEKLVRTTRESRERAEDAAARIPNLKAAIAAVERDIDARTSEPVERVRTDIEHLLATGSGLLTEMDHIAVIHRTASKKTSLPRVAGPELVERMNRALAAYRALDRSPLDQGNR